MRTTKQPNKIIKLNPVVANNNSQIPWIKTALILNNTSVNTAQHISQVLGLSEAILENFIRGWVYNIKKEKR